MKDLHARIDKLIELQNLSDRKFALEIGIPVSTLYTSRKRESDLPSSIIVAILNKYSKLNAKWLLTGEGEMWESDTKPLDSVTEKALKEFMSLYDDIKIVASFYKKRFEEAIESLEEANKEIATLRKKLDSKAEEKKAEEKKGEAESK